MKNFPDEISDQFKPNRKRKICYRKIVILSVCDNGNIASVFSLSFVFSAIASYYTMKCKQRLWVRFYNGLVTEKNVPIYCVVRLNARDNALSCWHAIIIHVLIAHLQAIAPHRHRLQASILLHLLSIALVNLYKIAYTIYSGLTASLT